MFRVLFAIRLARSSPTPDMSLARRRFTFFLHSGESAASRVGDERASLMANKHAEHGDLPQHGHRGPELGDPGPHDVPLSPGHTEITGWQLMPLDESDAVAALSDRQTR